MSYTVKQVASMAGVSVRTLHHYHHIGLLRPHTVTEAGYRLYGQEELERLQQILFHRELGFALADIKTILDRPDFDRLRALESHRAALVARRKRLATLIRTVERSVASIKGETIMEGHRLYDGFDVEAVLAQQQGYAAEVDERYDPATVEESRRRTSPPGTPEPSGAASSRRGRSFAEPWASSFPQARRRRIGRCRSWCGSTISISMTGSTPARWRCIAGSESFTSTTSGSRRTSTGSGRGSHASCVTPSGYMQGAHSAPFRSRLYEADRSPRSTRAQRRPRRPAPNFPVPE